jgi:hypothetical protein
LLADRLQPFDGCCIYHPAREQMAPKLHVFIDFLREPDRSGGSQLAVRAPAFSHALTPRPAVR